MRKAMMLVKEQSNMNSKWKNASDWIVDPKKLIVCQKLLSMKNNVRNWTADVRKQKLGRTDEKILACILFDQ